MHKVLFRADAGESIGAGDLLSFVYLSHEFEKHSWKVFFAIKDYSPARLIIKKYNLKNVRLIKSDASIADETSLIKKICLKEDIDCLFMQITEKSLDKYNELARPAPIMACVNYDGIITDNFDIAVNWHIKSSGDLYKDYKNKKICFILGFENVILPHYFKKDQIFKKVFNQEIENILITMGGVDAPDMTGKIMSTLSKEKDRYKIRVITGPGYKYRNDLQSFMKRKFKNFVLKHNVDNLLEDYLWADVAFGAGGITASELAAAHVPAVLIAISKNQIARSKYFASKGLSLYAGYYEELNEEKILNAFRNTKKDIELFRKNLSSLSLEGGSKKVYESIASRCS